MKGNINLLVIPYHDWRKIQAEGSRTRDAHFIESFRENKRINKLIIINRPISHLELLVKKKARGIKGNVIFKMNGFRLIEIGTRTYLIDFISSKSITHALKKRKWYFEEYEHPQFISFINESLEKIGVDKSYLLSQNIYAGGLCKQLKAEKTVFDAWDNFCLIPAVRNIKTEIKQSYLLYQEVAQSWLTNSLENIAYYKSKFGVNNITLLKNGVDLGRFMPTGKIPKDMSTIQRPIIGFGGKITHLFDADLYKYLIINNPNKSFVLIGQILDKDTYTQIGRHHNFYYLGDKHYDIYPDYVKHFDIGIVPYVINDKQHGGDSMKVYEYLAAGKKVIGTRGNGLEDLGEYIQLADSPKEFSDFISYYPKKTAFPVEKHTWNSKSERILNIFIDDNNET